MTSLRQRMTEDMQVRNLALNTQSSLPPAGLAVRTTLQKSPEQLGPEEIRAYQIYLTNEKKAGAWLCSHRRGRPAIPLQGLAQKGVVLR